MTEYYSQKSESQAVAPMGPGSPPLYGSAVQGGPPCLYSNNSIETENRSLTSHQLECVKALAGILSPYYRKSAHTLYSNVSRLVDLAPSINHVVMLTLTFPDSVSDVREAYKRYRSFNTNYFANHPEFHPERIAVKERTKKGVIHYHILAIVRQDVRSDFDFDAYILWLKGNNRFRRPCPTGNKYLASLRSDFKANLENYGFGKIFSLEPIQSNQQAIARYVGKYISKTIGTRIEEDKGARLVNYSRGWSKNSMQFAWYTPGSQEWRRKVRLFAEYTGCSDLYQLSEKFGSDWCYKYAEFIYGIDKTLSQNGGVLSSPHQAPELDRIAENVSTRQKTLNLVNRRSARVQRAEENKIRIHQIIKTAKIDHEPATPLTPEEKDNLHWNSMLRREQRQAEMHLSDEYLEELGVERKKKDIEPTPF